MNLKPCPFCGSLPSWTVFYDGYILTCGNPNCFAIVSIKGNNEKEVGNKWNTRAEEPAEKTAHWDINVDGYYPFCSHCGEATQHMSPFCPNCGYRMTTRKHGGDDDAE